MQSAGVEARCTSPFSAAFGLSFFFASGKSAPEECGVKVPAKNSNTTGLKQHIRDKHVEEYHATILAAGDITAFFPGSGNAVRREKITLAFAKNALPYQVFWTWKKKCNLPSSPPPSLLTILHFDLHLVRTSPPDAIGLSSVFSPAIYETRYKGSCSQFQLGGVSFSFPSGTERF